MSDYEEFVPVIEFRCLHSHVMFVARTRCEGAWKAYVRDVPGRSHPAECALVLHDGAPVEEKLARHLFPQFDKLPYAK